MLAQPKRLALLAYLAATPGWHSRETLLALLWPDVNAKRARASLRQSLYGIRHALGDGVLRVRGKTLLGIDRTTIACDAAEFGRLLDEGRDQEALALYTGPFMEGFHLSGVPEFEHWIDDKRQELQLGAVAAAWRLADAAQGTGDIAASRRWAERAVRLVPYDEAAARRYMQLLVAQGDRTLALRVYERLADSLSGDLGADPSPETTELADRVRQQATVHRAAPITDRQSAALPLRNDRRRVDQAGGPAESLNARAVKPVRGGGAAFRTRVVAPIIVILLTLLIYGYMQSHAGVPGGPIRSLVMLPLSTSVDDEQQKYFADEMTDALTAELGQITALKVISLTTAQQFRGTKITIPAIAEQLNVDAVVEGSVALHNGRVRVNVRLVEAATDLQLLSKTYEADLSDVLSVQKEIARSVADELRVELTGRQSARLGDVRQVNPDAYTAYLRGRYQFSRWTAEGWATAAQAFREAVALDSGYAAAWAGFSTSLSHLCYFGMPGSPPADQCQELADEAIARAVALDPGLSEAQVILGFRRWWGPHRDRDGAETALRQAIRLNPSNAEAYNRYAFLLATLGQYDEAIRNFERAFALDPLSPERATFRIYGYAVARRYGDAEAIARQAIALDPTFPNGYAWLGFFVLAPLQRFEEAIAKLEQAKELAGQNEGFEAMLGYARARAGQTREAETVLSKLNQGASAGRVSPYYISFVEIGLGRYEQAIESLERAYDEGWGHVIYLNAHAVFDPLRKYPRFQRIVQNVGLPEFQRRDSL